MKVRFIDPMMFGEFVDVSLEQGSYDSKWTPVVNVIFVKPKKFRNRFLTFYFGKYPGLQFSWYVKCLCPTCKKNRWRSLFFMKPLPIEKHGDKIV